MKWRIEILNQTVIDELDALPVEMRAKLDHIIRLIEEFGLTRVREALCQTSWKQALGDADDGP